MNNNNKALSQFEKDLKKINKLVRDDLIGRGRKQGRINKEILSFYNRAINMFYDDYDPIRYVRTYNTYTAIRRIKDVERTGAHDYEYTIGSVINGAFIHANNGDLNNGNYPNKNIPMPVNFNTKRLRRYKVSKRKYRAEAQWVFDRTFYEGIHGFHSGDPFSDFPNNKYVQMAYARGWKPPKPMKPSPKEEMDKMFDDFVDVGLNHMVNESFGRAFEKVFLKK